MAELATGPTRRRSHEADSPADTLCAGRNESRARTVPGDERRATSDESAAAGLYVHVPVCRSKCRYCGFYSVAAGGVDAGRLVDGLLRELERYDGIEFCTAYVGGGSPTALPAGVLVRLVRAIRARCPRAEEFTVECNPGQVDGGLLDQLRAAGVNRLSFGAQSFVARELELLGRGHSVEQTGSAVALARRAGFENVGLDLIFAIPGSTLADWQASLEAAMALNIDHVSAYSLSFEAGTVFEAWRQAGRLEAVDEELDRAMYEWAIERLERGDCTSTRSRTLPGRDSNAGTILGIGPTGRTWGSDPRRPRTSPSALGRRGAADASPTMPISGNIWRLWSATGRPRPRCRR